MSRFSFHDTFIHGGQPLHYELRHQNKFGWPKRKDGKHAAQSVVAKQTNYEGGTFCIPWARLSHPVAEKGARNPPWTVCAPQSGDGYSQLPTQWFFAVRRQPSKPRRHK